jgi:hypothetical protein
MLSSIFGQKFPFWLGTLSISHLLLQKGAQMKAYVMAESGNFEDSYHVLIVNLGNERRVVLRLSYAEYSRLENSGENMLLLLKEVAQKINAP